MTTEKDTVNTRAVFFVGGFDPKSPEAFFSRVDRENGRFEQLWDADITHQAFDGGDADIVCTQFQTSGQDEGHAWSTTTDFHYLSIDDIVLKDFSRNFLVRLVRYIISFADYTVTGTGMKFFWHGWRFSMYALYPMAMLLASLGLSLIAGSWAGSIGSSYPTACALIAFLACFAFCYQFVMKRGHVLHLMDLWSFSTEYQYRRRPDMDDKLNRFADQIYAAASSNQYDEILTIGHSTGGALILDATARVAERHPDFATHAANVTVLTVGSTALKIGLHPFSDWFRSRLKNLFEKTPVKWVEFQCVTDLINFHKTNPAELMRLDSTMQTPIHIDTIRVKNMIGSEVYGRIKNNYFRIHYQFVYANTQKYYYDFPAFCFGPAYLAQRLQVARDMKSLNPYLHNLSGRTRELS
ncbi:MAG: lipase [Rhizobiaceae bacterium]